MVGNVGWENGRSHDFYPRSKNEYKKKNRHKYMPVMAFETAICVEVAVDSTHIIQHGHCGWLSLHEISVKY
jgi:hypothetical protein